MSCKAMVDVHVVQLHLLEHPGLNQGKRSKGQDWFCLRGYSESLCDGYRLRAVFVLWKEECFGSAGRAEQKELLLFAHGFVLGQLTGAQKESKGGAESDLPKVSAVAGSEALIPH